MLNCKRSMWQLLGKGCVSGKKITIFFTIIFHSTFALRAKLFLLNFFSYFLNPFLGLFSFCAGDYDLLYPTVPGFFLLWLSLSISVITLLSENVWTVYYRNLFKWGGFTVYCLNKVILFLMQFYTFFISCS